MSLSWHRQRRRDTGTQRHRDTELQSHRDTETEGQRSTQPLGRGVGVGDVVPEPHEVTVKEHFMAAIPEHLWSSGYDVSLTR